MLLKETIRQVVQTQREELPEEGIPREKIQEIDLAIKHAIIISGIRRCGKSTLLRQLMTKTKAWSYINFDDPRLTGFELGDFERLEEVWNEEHSSTHFFFDEIQNIPEWERYIRRLLDKGKKAVISGSNASLLSRELGTRLTGRHLTHELFPFSYMEMTTFLHKPQNRESFQEYLELGGFPEYLSSGKMAMLQQLFVDILQRDIVARHTLREGTTLKELATYLLTNLGKEFSASGLAKLFQLGSVNTIISYISFLEDSYIISTIPTFSYSYKKRIRNPRKAYAIDTALARANSLSFSTDKGRVLENAVFLFLRRKYKEIYYYKSEKECDFIIVEKGVPHQAIQVCYAVNEENKGRELAGLQEAMEELKIPSGVIITEGQEDTLGSITLIPAWKWMQLR